MGDEPLAAVTDPVTVVLIGPTGAGKTSFLAATGRAFIGAAPAGWVGHHPGDALAELEARSRYPGTTETATVYDLEVGILSRATGVESRRWIRALDTPGAFLPALADPGGERAPATRSWLRRARGSRCLVLCAGVADGPRLSLTGVLDSLAGEAGAQLPFERVLVLLTGVESLCRQIARRIDRSAGNQTGPATDDEGGYARLRGLSPRQIASTLDLAALARDRVDGLERLALRQRKGSVLAVCGVGNRGFRAGRSDGPADGQAVPFGVGEAWMFLAAGLVRPPVVRLAVAGAWLRAAASDTAEVAEGSTL